MRKLVTIVIPAYNEMEVLPKLFRVLRLAIDRIHTITFEIIIVENGSTDQSLRVLLEERTHDRRIKIVQLQYNVGVDNGIIAGISYAIGDAAIVMNADLQDDPQLIPQFIRLWREGCDCAYAVIRSREGVSPARQYLIRFLYKVLHLVSMGRVPENVSDYRLLDRSLYSRILMHWHPLMFFRVCAALESRRAHGIVYDRPRRKGGASKMNVAEYVRDVRNAVATLIVHALPPGLMLTARPTRSLYPLKRTWGLKKRI